MDGTGDYFVVKVDGAVQSVSVGVKMLGGSSTSYLDFQGSADGSSYTSVHKHTISGAQNSVLELITSNTFDPSYRYIKFYFTKGSNVGVGPITITYIPDGSEGGETPEPEEPETPAYPENSYVKYSGALVEGDYIIVYDGKAMKNTVSSSRLEYSEVSPTNDYIVAPDASIVWHLAQNGDYWTIYNANANKYAASTGAKNKAQLLESGTEDYSLWTASGSDTYEFVNKKNTSNGVNANLRNNGTYGFACYAGSTGGALTLYKNN